MVAMLKLQTSMKTNNRQVMNPSQKQAHLSQVDQGGFWDPHSLYCQVKKPYSRARVLNVGY